MATVMRRSLTVVYVLIFLVLSGVSLIWLLTGRAVPLTLHVTALGYNSLPGGGYIGVDTRFCLPTGCELDAPRLQILIQTPAGWQRHDASSFGPTTPVELRPGVTNCDCFVLPVETQRWRLVVIGKQAGFRVRFAHRLSAYSGSLVRDSSLRIRPFWAWVCRQLPNSAGRAVEVQSEALTFQPKRHRLGAPHDEATAPNAEIGRYA
jgi:hypothetical protein